MNNEFYEVNWNKKFSLTNIEGTKVVYTSSTSPREIKLNRCYYTKPDYSKGDK